MKRLKKYKDILHIALAVGGASMIWGPIVVGYYTTHPPGQTPTEEQHGEATRFVANAILICVDNTEYLFNPKIPLFTPHYVNSERVSCQGPNTITTTPVNK